MSTKIDTVAVFASIHKILKSEKLDCEEKVKMITEIVEEILAEAKK